MRKSAGRAPSLRVLTWHLPYNWGKSTKKPQSGKKNLSPVKRNLSHSTVYILPKHPHITKTHTHTHKHTHILQNPHIHPHITKQYKTTTVQIKTNTVQDMSKWNSHNIIKCPQYKVTLMYIAHSVALLSFSTRLPINHDRLTPSLSICDHLTFSCYRKPHVSCRWNIVVRNLTHYSGRVTQICVSNTVKLSTSASSP